MKFKKSPFIVAAKLQKVILGSYNWMKNTGNESGQRVVWKKFKK
jgi:hypothetical protein